MVEQIALALTSLAALAFAALFWRAWRSRDDGSADLSFRTLAEVAPAGIWRTDTEGRCVYVNKAWERSAGVTDWQGDGWATALHPEDSERVIKTLMSAVAREKTFEDEWRWLRPDGDSVWVKGLGAPEYDDDDELVGYVGINIDIQRSKDLEAELHAARRRAEHEAQSKSIFLANMSHEIRTPMNGVIGFTELLLESDMTEDQKAQVSLISESGHAMMQLLNDILDHSRIESGQLQINKEPTDLRHKLKHCTKLIEPMARAKGLSMGIWIDEAVPPLLSLDPLRVRQVVLNLIGNAVKFTETGGIDVEARVENSSEGRSLLITVIDTGIGIDEDRLEDIFTPFTQEDGSVARRYGGTGLGLAISSQLVTMMGGHITVHSKRGVGTQFTVRLPLERVREMPQNEAQPKPRRKESEFRLAGSHVLIAEDHAINQQLVQAMAESLDLDVRLVADGEEAVNAVVEAEETGKPFDAILMDMQMPDVDGLEATRRLRALGFGADALPIIALTANCYPDDVAACRKAGMQSHLGKPITTVALARELSRWLAPGAELPVAGAPQALDDKVRQLVTTSSPDMAGLQDRYRTRRDSVLAELRESLAKRPDQTDWSKLASDLHKLAGVAANFGDPEIGEASRRLERGLKASEKPDELFEALVREWPNFEKAA